MDDNSSYVPLDSYRSVGLIFTQTKKYCYIYIFLLSTLDSVEVYSSKNRRFTFEQGYGNMHITQAFNMDLYCE